MSQTTTEKQSGRGKSGSAGRSGTGGGSGTGSTNGASSGAVGGANASSAASGANSGTSIEERLYSIRYKADDKSHLIIKNQDVCASCVDKPCNFFCPSDVYLWHDIESMTSVAFENCIECGTCRIACPYYNIEWVYPKGGYGITYRYG